MGAKKSNLNIKETENILLIFLTIILGLPSPQKKGNPHENDFF